MPALRGRGGHDGSGHPARQGGAGERHGEKDLGSGGGFPGIILACALADTAATYVTLQGMSVLYRLYYADWYIYLVMAVNGFLYTMIGAGCGLLLGSRLADVGGD